MPLHVEKGKGEKHRSIDASALTLSLMSIFDYVCCVSSSQTVESDCDGLCLLEMLVLGPQRLDQ